MHMFNCTNSLLKLKILLKYQISNSFLASTHSKSGSFFTIFLKFSILREWVKLKEKEVFALLNETPPNGQKYTKFIKHLIERENFWVKWKNEGKDLNGLRKSEI